jgi:hypothetical protein
MSSGLRSRTFCCADTGRFRQNLKIEIYGKIPEIHRKERGIQGLRHFQQIQQTRIILKWLLIMARSFVSCVAWLRVAVSTSGLPVVVEETMTLQ